MCWVTNKSPSLESVFIFEICQTCQSKEQISQKEHFRFRSVCDAKHGTILKVIQTLLLKKINTYNHFDLQSNSSIYHSNFRISRIYIQFNLTKRDDNCRFPIFFSVHVLSTLTNNGYYTVTLGQAWSHSVKHTWRFVYMCKVQKGQSQETATFLKTRTLIQYLSIWWRKDN